MTHNRPFIRTLLLTTALTLSGFAGAEILQCRDQAGATTYTDGACKTEVSTDRKVAEIGKAPGLVKISASTAGFAVAEQARAAAWANKENVARKFVIDLATLQTARDLTVTLDHDSAVIRDAARAVRRARSGGWTFWRL